MKYPQGNLSFNINRLDRLLCILPISAVVWSCFLFQLINLTIVLNYSTDRQNVFLLFAKGVEFIKKRTYIAFDDEGCSKREHISLLMMRGVQKSQTDLNIFIS